MGAWNFQKQFADDVENEVKNQTIRRNRKDGRDPKVGEIMSLYTGMRSPACRLLRRVVVKSREVVDFTFSDDGNECYLDNRQIRQGELYDIARADGFENDIEMRDWFRRHHGGRIEGFLFKFETTHGAGQDDG